NIKTNRANLAHGRLPSMWFASAKPPYGTLDAAEWAPSTASKADIPQYPTDVRFAPRKRTLVQAIGMSAKGQQQTSYQQKEEAISIDGLIARLRWLFELWKPKRTRNGN